MASKPHSTLSQYLALVNSFPRLTDEEELALWNRWSRDSDTAARDAVVRSNLRHVVAIALKHYQVSDCPLGDLIAEGNFGLVYSLYRFDPSLGKPLMAYAKSWVRAFVLKYVINTWSVVKPDAVGAKRFFTLRREAGRLTSSDEQRHDRYGKLADRFGISREEVSAEIGRVGARDASLSVSPPGDTTAAPVDRLASPQQDQEHAYAEREEMFRTQKVVRAAMGTLDAREQFIIMKHLMAERDEWVSLDNLGRGLGISRTRAGQIERRAKRKLRHYLAERSMNVQSSTGKPNSLPSQNLLDVPRPVKSAQR